jgi:inorganic pyrophosphatase
LPCRALGVLNIEQRSAGASDRRVRNDRLVVTPLVNPREAARSIHDIPERVHRELEHFFTSAVFFEPKDPRVLGWGGPLDADALLREGEKAYAKR